VDFAAAFLADGLLEGAALIHGCGGDDASGVGNGFEASEFTGGELHGRIFS
jgi:hypothetical protein